MYSSRDHVLTGAQNGCKLYGCGYFIVVFPNLTIILPEIGSKTTSKLSVGTEISACTSCLQSHASTRTRPTLSLVYCIAEYNFLAAVFASKTVSTTLSMPCSHAYTQHSESAGWQSWSLR
jgi:hypothetical protein